MKSHGFRYDFVISYAGEDKAYAKRLYDVLVENGAEVFFAPQADLWGKNLYEHLAEIYSKKGRFCILLISQHYVQKPWTRHEWRNAQERALQDADTDYILPIQIDDTELPGLPSTIAYLDVRKNTVDDIAHLALQKLDTVSVSVLEDGGSLKSSIIAPPNTSSFVRSAVQSLNGIHESEWLEAIDALERSEDPHATQILKLTAEHHHTRRIRNKAALAHVRHTRYHDISWSAIRETALQQADQKNRQSAYTVLGNMGGHKAVKILAEALQQEEHHHLREVIIHNLGLTAREGDPYALQFLSAYYQQITDIHEKQKVLNALQYFNTDDATVFLENLLPDLEGQILREAIISLIIIGTPKAEKVVATHLLNVESESIQNQIIIWLGETGRPLALKILKKVKDDPRIARAGHATRRTISQLENYQLRHRNHP